MKCTAHTVTGKPCAKDAIKGGMVCWKHGGAAPQVQTAAKNRLMMAADEAAATLIRLSKKRGKGASDADIRAACIAVLDRAGLKPTDRLELSGPGGMPIQVEGELDYSKIPTEELELMLAQQERLVKLGAIKPGSSASSMVVDTAAKQVTDGSNDAG